MAFFQGLEKIVGDETGQLGGGPSRQHRPVDQWFVPRFDIRRTVDDPVQNLLANLGAGIVEHQGDGFLVVGGGDGGGHGFAQAVPF